MNEQKKLFEDDLLCSEKLNEGDAPFFEIDFAWQNVMGFHQNVRPTTELEQWIVDQKVPPFSDIPSPWYAAASIVLFPITWTSFESRSSMYRQQSDSSVTVLIGAFCRQTRRCLCAFDDDASPASHVDSGVFCVDAEEFFHHPYLIIDREFNRHHRKILTLPENFPGKVFPFNLELVDVNLETFM